MKAILSCLFLGLCLTVSSVTAQTIQSSTSSYSSEINSSYENEVTGTFHFIFPKDVTLFWSEEFITSLHPQIKALREESNTHFWNYNEYVTIVIYSRSTINHPEFVPTTSPYQP